MTKGGTMLFTVLAVGDGACSIARRWPGSRVMVVDCGTTGNAGVSPAKILADELSWDSMLIDTVVVTHFDSDHWRGLRDLPKHWRHAPIREVEFRYPAFLPGAAGQVQLASLLLQVSRLSGPIFGALDLFGAWEQAGVLVRRRPVRRGSRFTGGGSAWAVHWPPADDSQFGVGIQREMRAVGQMVRELAEKVDVFRRALGSVQAIWFNEANHQTDSARSLTDVTGKQLSDALHAELGDEGLKAFTKRVNQFNNVLSMVHSGGAIANFGDCEKAGLDTLFKIETATPTLQAAYPIILAPHHGTVTPKAKVRTSFPRASCALVSQNGQTRYKAGRKTDQQEFKDAVTAGIGIQFDTYCPTGRSSWFYSHLRFRVTT
jgi:hypothetical protein